MRKFWIMVAAAMLLVGAGAVRAAGDDDAQLARQCPGIAKWIQARKAGMAAVHQSGTAAKPTQPALRTELLEMSHADQQARNAFVASGNEGKMLGQAIMDADARHLPRVRQIVTQQGFPTVAQVGEDGVAAAWLLVQHADRDPAFQLHVLDELNARPDHGGVGAQQYTLLVDRVLVAQHRPQRYGTQFKPVDGKLQADPIEDVAHVDRRRAAVGLPPLADYECVLRASYHMPVSSPGNRR